MKFNLDQTAKDYAERVCNGEFPITYTRQRVVEHTKNDFITGANKYRQHVVDVLKENYEASKRMTDVDKSAHDLLKETYEDLILIFSKVQAEPSSPTGA